MTEEHERMDDELRRLAGDYHEPPETPREEMWGRIVAMRREGERRNAAGRLDGRVVGRQARRRALWQWSLAAAAVLTLGVLIGRWTGPRSGDAGNPPTVASVPPKTTEASAALRLTAAQHLDRVQTFLSVFRAEARSGHVDTTAPQTARGLLTNTRLLEDSPAAKDPALKTVLDDVDLVLSQIAQYRGGRGEIGKQDLEFIQQGIDQRGVMLKLQAVAPSDAERGFAQGAL